MWSENYSPRSIDELVDQESVKSVMERTLSSPGEMPHLLFHGPSGTGKTVTWQILAQEVLGEEWREKTLELSALDLIPMSYSDKRDYKKRTGRDPPPTGLDAARDLVKSFARKKGFGLVVVEDADSLSGDSQQALRRQMEMYASTSRFVFVANSLHSILSPIRSRCSTVKFRPIPEEDTVDRLRDICDGEEVDYEEDGLREVATLSGGDLRLAINTLQKVAVTGEVTKERVASESGLVPPEDLEEVAWLLSEGLLSSAFDYTLKLTDRHKSDIPSVIRQLPSAFGDHEGQAYKAAALYDHRISRGGHPETQLTGFLGDLMEMR